MFQVFSLSLYLNVYFKKWVCAGLHEDYYDGADSTICCFTLCTNIFAILSRQNSLVELRLALAYPVLCNVLVQQHRSSEVMVKYDNEFSMSNCLDLFWYTRDSIRQATRTSKNFKVNHLRWNRTIYISKRTIPNTFLPPTNKCLLWVFSDYSLTVFNFTFIITSNFDWLIQRISRDPINSFSNSCL